MRPATNTQQHKSTPTTKAPASIKTGLSIEDEASPLSGANSAETGGGVGATSFS
jgi:hypothetical protein